MGISGLSKESEKALRGKISASWEGDWQITYPHCVAFTSADARSLGQKLSPPSLKLNTTGIAAMNLQAPNYLLRSIIPFTCVKGNITYSMMLKH